MPDQDENRSALDRVSPGLVERIRWPGPVFWGVFATALVSVLLRVPFLSVPMITDEGGYAYVAKFWSDDYQLYRDIPFDRPQLIFWLYRAAFVLFGTDVESIRLFAAFYNAATVVAVFLLCRRIHSTREGLIGAGLFAVFSVSPSIEGFTANAELFMLLPGVVAAHLTFDRRWFSAGLVGAIAVLLKPSGAAAFALIGAWVLVVGAPWLRSWGLGALGALVGVLPSVVHGTWIGAEHFWASIALRLGLYNAETVAASTQWRGMRSGLEITLPAWAFLALAAGLGAVRRAGPERSFAALWLLASLLGIAAGGWWRQHYFMQLIPPLCLLASAGLPAWRAGQLRVAWGIALALALVPFVQRDLRLMALEPDAISWRLYHRPGYLLSDEIARYVQRTTKPDETIYVAFAQAEFYYLAERRNAAPQFYYLAAEHSGEVFGRVIEALEQRRPSLVLLVQDPPPQRMSRADFQAILDRGYAWDADFSLDPDRPMIRAFRRRPAPPAENAARESDATKGDPTHALAEAGRADR